MVTSILRATIKDDVHSRVSMEHLVAEAMARDLRVVSTKIGSVAEVNNVEVEDPITGQRARFLQLDTGRFMVRGERVNGDIVRDVAQLSESLIGLATLVAPQNKRNAFPEPTEADHERARERERSKSEPKWGFYSEKKVTEFGGSVYQHIDGHEVTIAFVHALETGTDPKHYSGYDDMICIGVVTKWLRSVEGNEPVFYRSRR